MGGIKGDGGLELKAEAVARRRGLAREPCRHCDEDGVLHRKNALSETGFSSTDPCPHCAGYGYWYQLGRTLPTYTVVDLAAEG